MALAMRRRSPCRPLAIPVQSETAVGVERDAINAGPVYRRTMPHSEVIAPVHLSCHNLL